VAPRAGKPSLARKLGARVRALREEVGLTQEAVAWACEIPKAHLSRIESGQRLPSVPVLFALAKELRVDAMDIVGFDLRRPGPALLDAARRGDRTGVLAALSRLSKDGR
jgi:transcriptional regulator with XRE-family HTH domain